jgi:hypothetical protein
MTCILCWLRIVGIQLLLAVTIVNVTQPLSFVAGAELTLPRICAMPQPCFFLILAKLLRSHSAVSFVQSKHVPCEVML